MNANPEFRNILIAYNKLRKHIKSNDDDIYAGAYVNSDGYLTVLLTAVSEAEQDRYKAIAEYDRLLFEDADYSYRHLASIMDRFNQAIEANYDEPDSIWSHIFGFGILDDKNCIRVSIIGMTDELVRRFKEEVLDSSELIFDSCTERAVASTLINPGDKVENEASGTYCSMGYRTGFGGVLGFVTAGHGFNVGDLAYDYNGTEIGMAKTPQIGNHVDVVFIQTSSTTTATTDIAYTGDTLIMECYDAPVGASIYKVGATTGYTAGFVESDNYTTIYEVDGETIELTDTGLATCTNEGGDSGGIVTSSGYCTGIVTARNTTTLKTIYTKATNISDYYGALPY